MDANNLSQDEIKRQIALLQQRLITEDATTITTKSPKRKSTKDDPKTLVPATPSPRKKRRVESAHGPPIPGPLFQSTASGSRTATFSRQQKPAPAKEYFDPGPSNLLSKLSKMTHDDDEDEEVSTVQRSTGFNQAAKVQPVEVSSKRDENLAIIEDFVPGPYEHPIPSGDPNFERLEPHSHINLSSRSLSHEDLSDYLRGRFYISPSRLYSCIRLLPDKKGYDVPVPGDWVTIAVVAERLPIRHTRAPVAIEREDGDVPESKYNKQKNAQEPERPSKGKKFVTMKLIDFGARAGKASVTGGTSVIRGDAFLNLLLFEADSIEYLLRDDNGKPKKVYKGGSKGAFESMFNLGEGDVVALLNPKLLKPYQRSGDKPHPVDNILAVTPESAESIVVIGRAKDLGKCAVQKQDGKICGSWYDKRVSDACEYHVQNAVSRRRAARPEFTASTMNLSSTSKHKRQHDYDPRRQWGLAPEPNARSSSTYFVAGHVVNGASSTDPQSMYLSETIGREGQAKAKRQLKKDADKTLKNLLSKDKDGMKAVMKAREVGRSLLVKDEGKATKGPTTSSSSKTKLASSDAKKDTKDTKGKKRQVFLDSDDDDDDSASSHSDSETGEAGLSAAPARTYSAKLIKSIGFDPTIKPGQAGQQRLENVDIQDKLKELHEARKLRLIQSKDVDLGSKPGPKIRSGVKVPEHVRRAAAQVGLEQSKSTDGEEPEDTGLTLGGEEDMVDLDDF